jgi:hypothetical protein
MKNTLLKNKNKNYFKSISYQSQIFMKSNFKLWLKLLFIADFPLRSKATDKKYFIFERRGKL